MRASKQILQAAILGTQAFNSGVKCAPCLDNGLMDMLVGRTVGVTPEGEATTIAILDAWKDAWVAANLAA